MNNVPLLITLLADEIEVLMSVISLESYQESLKRQIRRRMNELLAIESSSASYLGTNCNTRRRRETRVEKNAEAGGRHVDYFEGGPYDEEQI